MGLLEELALAGEDLLTGDHGVLHVSINKNWIPPIHVHLNSLDEIRSAYPNKEVTRDIIDDEFIREKMFFFDSVMLFGLVRREEADDATDQETGN